MTYNVYQTLIHTQNSDREWLRVFLSDSPVLSKIGLEQSGYDLKKKSSCINTTLLSPSQDGIELN